jgi:hypothetical protein
LDFDRIVAETWRAAARRFARHRKVFDSADSQSHRKRAIKSISYCKEEIEAQYAEWLDRQIGKSNGAATAGIEQQNGFFTRETIVEHLENQFPRCANAKIKRFARVFGMRSGSSKI